MLILNFRTICKRVNFLIFYDPKMTNWPLRHHSTKILPVNPCTKTDRQIKKIQWRIKGGNIGGLDFESESRALRKSAADYFLKGFQVSLWGIIFYLRSDRPLLNCSRNFITCLICPTWAQSQTANFYYRVKGAASAKQNKFLTLNLLTFRFFHAKEAVYYWQRIFHTTEKGQNIKKYISGKIILQTI